MTPHPQTTLQRLLLARAFSGRRLIRWPDWLDWAMLQACVADGLITKRSYGPQTYGHTDYFLPEGPLS